MGMLDQQLVVSFPDIPGSEVIVPMDRTGMILNADVPEGYTDAAQSALMGDHQPMIEILRPIAEPLIPFLQVPEPQTNIHALCLQYYKALILGGQTASAVELSKAIPFDTTSSEFTTLASQLVFTCIREEQYVGAELMLSLLLRALPQEEFVEIAFPAADALRTAGQHELCLEIYGSLIDSDNPVIQRRSLLWAGYSSSVGGDPAQARAILSELDEPDREDENFVVYCLARGRTGLEQGDLRECMHYLSRAMVLTPVEQSYKPELYYLLLRGYRETGQTEASSLLQREFQVFYPDSPWLAKSLQESKTNPMEQTL
ncbi:MAG: hypothetical protein Q7Q73_15840 [Verrucomicrobiota bacterium JB024]|nr:hypothetical protein [Verrucomicrobiota bacterium JB024]